MKYTIKYVGVSGREYSHTDDYETRNAAQAEAFEMKKAGCKIISVRKTRITS